MTATKEELKVIRTNRNGNRTAYVDGKGTTSLDCTKCGETKPIDGFHYKRGGFFNTQARCKECKNEESQQYVKNKKENNSSVTVNEKAQQHQQPQDKQATRNLSIDLDATTWKLIKMQAIFEDKDINEMIEIIIMNYMTTNENSVLKW